jgi:BASS family bile acid:Na+ symporter
MQLIDILIPLVLALTMFGVGTSLEFKDFKQIFQQPKSVILGLSLQMLFLPLFAFACAFCLPISNEWKLGLVILSLCPGGATSNFISYLLDLRTALSISLTAINSIIIIITIPVGVSIATSLFVGDQTALEMPFGDTLLNVLFIILLPAFLGLLFNQRYTDLSTRLKTPIKVITTLLLAGVFAIKFFADKESGGGDIQWADLSVLLPLMLGFHLISMFLSFWMAIRVGVERLSAITIGIEVGLQNTTLALLVSSILLSNVEVAKPTLVYAIFSFFTTLAFGYLVRRFRGSR